MGCGSSKPAGGLVPLSKPGVSVFNDQQATQKVTLTWKSESLKECYKRKLVPGRTWRIMHGGTHVYYLVSPVVDMSIDDHYQIQLRSTDGKEVIGLASIDGILGTSKCSFHSPKGNGTRNERLLCALARAGSGKNKLLAGVVTGAKPQIQLTRKGGTLRWDNFRLGKIRSNSVVVERYMDQALVVLMAFMLPKLRKVKRLATAADIGLTFFPPARAAGTTGKVTVKALQYGVRKANEDSDRAGRDYDNMNRSRTRTETGLDNRAQPAAKKKKGKQQNGKKRK